MKYYDISVDLTPDMHRYPGDPRFHTSVVRSLSDGDQFDLHRVHLSNHAGTHVDAPAHFVKGGPGITDLPLEVLNGRSRVIHIHNTEKVDLPELQQHVLVDDFRILFKTKNSLIWNTERKFRKDYAYLTPEAASYLVENGIKLIGFDYISVDQYGNDSFPVHRILLESGAAILEGLNLSEVEEGEFELICLPLRLKGLDAAPARAMLKK